MAAGSSLVGEQLASALYEARFLTTQLRLAGIIPEMAIRMLILGFTWSSMWHFHDHDAWLLQARTFSLKTGWRRL